MKREIVCLTCCPSDMWEDPADIPVICRGPLRTSLFCDLCGKGLDQGTVGYCVTYSRLEFQDYYPWEDEYLERREVLNLALVKQQKQVVRRLGQNKSPENFD